MLPTLVAPPAVASNVDGVSAASWRSSGRRRAGVAELLGSHLTIVFAALAISRHLQDATGISIKKLVRTLRPLRSVTIDVAGHTLTAEPTITPDASNILNAMPSG